MKCLALDWIVYENKFCISGSMNFLLLSQHLPSGFLDACVCCVASCSSPFHHRGCTWSSDPCEQSWTTGLTFDHTRLPTWYVSAQCTSDWRSCCNEGRHSDCPWWPAGFPPDSGASLQKLPRDQESPPLQLPRRRCSQMGWAGSSLRWSWNTWVPSGPRCRGSPPPFSLPSPPFEDLQRRGHPSILSARFLQFKCIYTLWN